MAAAASAQKPCTWHIDELHEVAVYKDNEEYTNANIILDCFVTDKQNVELKSQKRAGRLRVIFPVPSRGQTQSRVILQETFTIFMSDYVREEDNFITVPIKHLKTWTKSEFCEIILKEFLHLKEVRKQNYPVKLTFCSLESYSFDEAVKVCNTVIGRGHTESSASAKTGRQSRHVCFKYGCLDLEEADMVACTMSSTLNLENGIVSKALLDGTGGELQHEMNRDYPGGVKAGEIAVLRGYELKCSFVAFGVMAPWRKKTWQSDSAKEDYCRTCIEEFMIKCMKEGDRKKCKSIAFPAIGSGNLGYPLHVVADQMFNTAHKWFDENSKSSIENITFVIYHTDEEAFKAFKDAEKTYIQNNTKSPVKEPRATQISPRQAADSSTDVSNTSHRQVENKTVSSSEQSSSLKHSLKLTHTTVMHVQNPESNRSAVQPDVEEMIVLPSANTGCLMQFFNVNLLKSLGKKGCDIFFSDDTVCVKGTEETTKMGKQKLKEAIEELRRLCVETISIPRSFEQMIINQEVNDIESEMGVYCSIDTLKKNVTFYGKTMKQVTEAKVRLERLFTAHQITNTSQALQLEDEFENDTSMKRVSDKQKKPAESRSFWSLDTKKFITFVTSENIKIKVYSADILSSLPVDCIVNAANVNLAHGGGVAKAIAKAAGKDLTQEGYDYLKSHGKLKVGEACYTKAGKLPYKLVIHAVGPCWSDHAPHSQEKVEKCELALYNAVINSLSLAEKEGMRTIAVPAISSGIFGCPAELCCVQYGKAILHYSQLSKYPLREIHFVDKNLDIISHIQEAFAAMMPGERTSRLYKPVDVKKQTARDQNRRKDKGAIDGQKHKTLDIETAGPEIKNKAYPLTSNNRNQREKPLAQGYPYIHYEKPLGHYKETFTCHLGQGQVVYVYSTNLLTLQKIEMIACGDVPAGNGHGAVTKKLIEMGGKDYKKAKENAFRSKFVTNGSVVICNGGNNNFRFVAHAILTPWKKSDTEKERRKAVTSIFTEIFHGMKQCKCHSLALPLLGTGIGQGDPGYCAERLFQSLLMFCSKNKSYRFSINLVHMESEKTRIATEVIKRMVQGLVTDFEPVMPIRDRQKQKAGSDSKRGKPPGRPLSASQYPKSKPQMLVSGSKSYDSRRADKNYGTSNSTLSGFDKGRAKMQSPPRRMAPSINTNTSVPQGISDSDHSEDEEQSSYPKDPGTNDTHSCSSESSNENLPLGRLKIYEVSRTERQTENFGNYKTESTKSEEMLNKDQSYHDESDEDSDKDDNNREEDAETCVICMEDITDPQKLSCGHVFCADCIKEQFTYKQACPTCGKVCGIIKGDQPYGRMDVVINDRASCAGFESSGRIEITYKFPDGTQEDNHPCPGQRYKGITRTAYLPNNRKGREICDMLKVAFKRKLVFTIGRSRTTGADGVITWNDIHHKTDPKPHSQFGYPDPTYLDRVTEELEVKGVTVKDIPADHATRPRRR